MRHRSVEHHFSKAADSTPPLTPRLGPHPTPPRYARSASPGMGARPRAMGPPLNAAHPVHGRWRGIVTRRLPTRLGQVATAPAQAVATRSLFLPTCRARRLPRLAGSTRRVIAWATRGGSVAGASSKTACSSILNRSTRRVTNPSGWCRCRGRVFGSPRRRVRTGRASSGRLLDRHGGLTPRRPAMISSIKSVPRPPSLSLLSLLLLCDAYNTDAPSDRVCAQVYPCRG